MFNFFKKSKKSTISTPLFIIASLLALILLGFFSVYFKINSNTYLLPNKQVNDKYYFKKLEKTDPLITVVPNMNNMLAGPIISPNDPSFGPETALITIVEYSDFLCDFCQKQEIILKNIIQRFPDKIKLIWKDYPENDYNSISFQAALAGRCAAEQNKFWQYHDLIYKNNNELDQNKFLNLAEQLDLNKNKFQQCFNKKTPQRQIKNNILEANALEITGIPFIYLNQQEIMGQVSEEELMKMIEAELK